jgi:hypothetical protein
VLRRAWRERVCCLEQRDAAAAGGVRARHVCLHRRGGVGHYWRSSSCAAPRAHTQTTQPWLAGVAACAELTLCCARCCIWTRTPARASLLITRRPHCAAAAVHIGVRPQKTQTPNAGAAKRRSSRPLRVPCCRMRRARCAAVGQTRQRWRQRCRSCPCSLATGQGDFTPLAECLRVTPRSEACLWRATSSELHLGGGTQAQPAKHLCICAGNVATTRLAP